MAKTREQSPSFSESRIERWYRTLVGVFALIAIVLVCVIVYFSFTKTTITVTAQPSSETVEFAVSLSSLDGVVMLTDVEGSKTVAVTEKSSAEAKTVAPAVSSTEKAKGTVTIVNTYTADQPLVEKTRLMSKEGILFRTTKTVTVPKGGEVTVDIEADEAGPTGVVPATRFEVVALWSGLKDKIYATSAKPTVGGGATVAENATATVITQTDIANAKKQLHEDLFAKANERFDSESADRSELKEVDFRLSTPVIQETLRDEQTPAAGTTAAELTVTQKLTVATAMLKKSALENAIQEAVTQQLGEGASIQKTDGYPLANTTVVMTEIKDSMTDATLTVTVTVPLLLTADDKKIDTTKLANKTPEEVQQYLLTFSDVQSVDVTLSPFWATKTPSNTSKITIRVNPAESTASEESVNDSPQETPKNTNTATNAAQKESTESNTNDEE